MDYVINWTVGQCFRGRCLTNYLRSTSILIHAPIDLTTVYATCGWPCLSSWVFTTLIHGTWCKVTLISQGVLYVVYHIVPKTRFLCLPSHVWVLRGLKFEIRLGKMEYHFYLLFTLISWSRWHLVSVCSKEQSISIPCQPQTVRS